MKITRKAVLFSAGSALALSLAAAPAAIAQDGAQDREVIVVTARLREETLQDVPFSLNAQTQDDIRNTGSGSLEDVSRNVASLSIQNLGPGQSQVAIRGVSAGQIVRDQPGVKEQVGVYLDESVISLSLFTPDLDLYDLNRVETLRGPQGTLFGSGSIGGTLRYITNQPDVDEFAASAEASVEHVQDGDWGGSVRGMVNIPIVEGQVAARAVAYYTEYGGYIDAVRPDFSVDEDVNSGHRIGGRLAVAFEPNSNLRITPRILYQEIEADGFNREEDYNILANPFTTTRQPVTLGDERQYLQLDEQFTDELFIADLTVEWDAGPVTLTSITSYTDRDILVSRDASSLTGSVSFDLGLGDAATLLPSNLRDTTTVEMFTQEVRVASNSEGRFQWLVGAFYSDIQRVYGQTLPTPGWDAAAVIGGLDPVGALNVAPPNSPFFSNIPYDFEQIAIFGEASFDITDRLTATAGVRWFDFEESRTLTFDGLFAAETNAAPGNTSSDGFAPRVMLSYDVNDDIQLNAQISNGFRLGGVNDPLNAPLCSPTDLQTFGNRASFEDETLWNYEIGVKTTILGGRGTFNAAAFYNDISDLQVTLDAGTCSSRIVFNVPEAHTMGAEFEFSAQLTENLDVALTASWIESEFDSTVTSTAGGVTSVIGGIAEGNRLPSVPEFQMAAAATWEQPVNLFGRDAEWFASGVVQYVGDRITQPGDQVTGFGTFSPLRTFGGVPAGTSVTIDPILDSYTTLNLRTGVRYENWEASLWVNNVTDEDARLSFDRERGGFARLGFHTMQPRTIGVTLRADF